MTERHYIAPGAKAEARRERVRRYLDDGRAGITIEPTTGSTESTPEPLDPTGDDGRPDVIAADVDLATTVEVQIPPVEENFSSG